MNKKHKRTALLLINLGTPDAPTIPAVARYLTEFLNDKYVITLPWLFRTLLVNLIIIPFRVINSTRLYKLLWTLGDSPLLAYLKSLKFKLQAVLEPHITVFAAMRYQHPSLRATLADIQAGEFERLIVLPLYPQFAESTTTSTNEKVEKIVKKWKHQPEVRYIEQFHEHPGYIEAYAEKIRSYNLDKYDFILFSYHGLPISHIENAHNIFGIGDSDCTNPDAEHAYLCYRASCYDTTRLLVERLNLPKERYTTSFQSRLSKNWLEPFSDKTLIDLAHRGYKRVLVVAPSFVADCLETIVEIGIEYKLLFREHGGDALTLVESLNDDDRWVEGVKSIISQIKD